MAAPIRQALASLLNGVSQQPPSMRSSSQADVQENLMSSLAYGLRKRPPTTHVAQLDPSTAGYDTAFIHSVNRDESTRYDVVVVNGDLKVFDKITGVAQSVLFTDGKSYLSGSSFRASTVGDYTFLVNQGVTVKRGTTVTAAPVYEALLFVRQADFSTDYGVTLNGTTVTITTVDMTNASSRAQISTTNIAADLLTALNANNTISGQFSFTQYGSTIYLTRQDGADFTMSTTDGLADKGLKGVKGEVQIFEDLPARAKNGMIVKVAGDLANEKDDYWVQYDDAGQPEQSGVWRECAAPNTVTSLDQTTMPWALVRRGVIKSGLKAAAVPPQPFVGDGVFVTYDQGFGTDTNGNAVDPNVDQLLSSHGQSLTTPAMSITSPSAPRIVRATLDVDTSTMLPGAQARVDMQMNSGSGFTTVASKYYGAGMRSVDTIDAPMTLPNGSSIRLVTNYIAGQTPPVPNRTYWINVRGLQNKNGGSLTHGILQSRKVSFNPVQVYPSSTQVVLTVDGTSFTYTCSGDVTGTTIATALTALVNANASFSASNTGAGVLTVKRTADNTAPTVTCVVNLSQATTLVDYSQAFLSNEHVGRIVKNLTDGSSATITGNSATTVVTAGLTGGISNKFNVGDVCEIDGSGVYFVFRPVEWDQKGVGGSNSDEYPSFLDKTIAEVFFFQDRLGFTAEENILMSQTGNLFNFFRQTATNVLDDDPIDIQSTFEEVAKFDHAIVWNADLYLFSGTGHQFVLSGDPLTPANVRIDHVSSYPMSGKVRPKVLGSSIFWCRDKSAHVQVFEYLQDRFGRKHCVEQTKTLPSYIPANAKQIAGDAALEFLVVLADGDPGALYVYQYHLDQVYFDQKQQASWSRWVFPGATVIGIDMLNGVLSLVLLRSDGVYFETIDVGHIPASTSDFRDRQTSGAPVNYTVRYRLSPLFLRDKNDAAITSGRVQVRYLDVGYTDTTGFVVSVTPLGRTTEDVTFTATSPSDGSLRVPVLCATKNLYRIEITDTTAGCCAFTNIEWEGTYTNRDKLS